MGNNEGNALRPHGYRAACLHDNEVNIETPFFPQAADETARNQRDYMHVADTVHVICSNTAIAEESVCIGSHGHPKALHEPSSKSIQHRTMSKSGSHESQPDSTKSRTISMSGSHSHQPYSTMYLTMSKSGSRSFRTADVDTNTESQRDSLRDADSVHVICSNSAIAKESVCTGSHEDESKIFPVASSPWVM